MKSLFTFFILLSSGLLHAQSNIEIFLLDLTTNNNTYQLTNPKNISNNEGYDNQPSFINDNAILFSSTRNEQTDIAQYRSNYDTKTWLNFSDGGEYSPLKIPNQNAFSAVRLDKDGKQRLYSYSLRNGESTELIKDLVVAYYTWYNDDVIVSAVIEDKNLNLYVSNIKEGWNRKYESNVGRSFHKIPNTNLVSYISKQDANNWQIKSLNPLTGETRVIANTLPGVEDICWLINGTILSGKDNVLFGLNKRYSSSWKEVADLKSVGIQKITRIASNSTSSKLLIAGDIGTNTNTNQGSNDSTNTSDSNTNTSTNSTFDAGAIVQKHIEPFNKGDLNAFANAFSENVVVSRFPNQVMSQGRQKLKEGYAKFFKENTNLAVKVNNRMVLKNLVIDEELVTVNKRNNRQVTVYTTSEKGIETMTFISNSKTTTNPEIIVDKQLEVYSKRDIEGFISTFSNDVKLYSYPDTLTSDGKAAVRKTYTSWFERAKKLDVEIKKRFVIGNKVIDLEEVTANDQVIEAIAIYEIENGLVKKATFIQ